MHKDDLDPVLQTALNLDGSEESIKTFYADWVSSYDKDTLGFNYAAPLNAVNLLQSQAEHESLGIDPKNPEIAILDAGCGTGQLAKLLYQAGYKNIDGFDLSEDMVEKAQALNIYKNLQGGVNLNLPIRDEWKKKYDCTICIGVFTPGHVPPEALSNLVDMTRAGGMVIVSTRQEYYETEHYQSVADGLMDCKKIVLLNSLLNASYTNDEKAHYWVYCAL